MTARFSQSVKMTLNIESTEITLTNKHVINNSNLIKSSNCLSYAHPGSMRRRPEEGGEVQRCRRLVL